MKFDNASQAMDIVYGAILETLSKLLREHRENDGFNYHQLESVHDELAEAIEASMGLEIRGGTAACRINRIIRDGCYESNHPTVAVWLFHEALARETLTERLEDEIRHAGREGAWDCVSTRSLAKAISIMNNVMEERVEHERCAVRLSLRVDQNCAHDHVDLAHAA